VSRRDIAVVAFRIMALWFAVSGVTGVASALIRWPRQEDPSQIQGAWLGLAQAGLFVPVGGVIWLLGDWLSLRVFPEAAGVSSGLTRADLWSAATLCIGLYLLSQAIPQLVYWLVVWRLSRGTALWAVTSDWRSDSGVAYQLAFRAQLGETITRLVLGAACLLGPDRLRNLLARLRREAFESTLVSGGDDQSTSKHPGVEQAVGADETRRPL